MVVKVGTSLLASSEGGVQTRRFATLAREIAALKVDGVETILASSGAIGLGVQKLGLRAKLEAPGT